MDLASSLLLGRTPELPCGSWHLSPIYPVQVIVSRILFFQNIVLIQYLKLIIKMRRFWLSAWINVRRRVARITKEEVGDR